MSERKQRPLLEVRSIDYIPRNERHGKVWHQAPFWFSGNFVLTTMVTGFIGPAMGLGALYSIAAIIIGVMFGTFFMAFHANQGPRMGLPQMIQSRAQFGVRGAVVPFAAVVFVYIGFNVFNTILATDAINTVLPEHRTAWYPLFIGIAVVLAILGHDVLHVVQRWLTYLLIAIFGLLSIGAVLTVQADAALVGPGFSWVAFFAQLAAAAGYQISYSVYVSDYSRYLPHDTPTRKVVFWTYLGAAGSALWLMSLGTLLASAFPEPSAIGSIRDVGNAFIPGLGSATVLLSIPAMLGIMSVNCYGAMLTTISAIDCFYKMVPTLKVRVIGICVIAAVIFAITLAIPDSYLDSFNTFVLLMLYFLIPWTAVNLVDFYCIRKGQYAVTEIFNPNGIYGRWGGAGLAAYFLGMLAMVPFVALSFYTGPMVEYLGGVDIAFVVGLAVAAWVYWLLARNMDFAKEQQAIKLDAQAFKETGL